jgi:DNA-binding LytR/AlgR family response regulator
MNSTPVVYKDFWFKIIGCLVSSYIIDALNRNESIFQRLGSRYFYIDMAGGFVIALILWEIVRFATRYLDKKLSWTEHPVKRTLSQLLVGVVLPSLFSFIFTLLWMRLAYDQDIFKTTWLYNEFYTVIIIILFINLIYFSWWLFLVWKQQQDLMLSTENKIGVSDQQSPAETIEVTKAGKTILLPQNNIAYSYLNNGYCYIKPFEGESFVTTYTLDELTKMLSQTHHFRVNRQILINKKACKTYKSIEFGKIELELDPASKIPVIVSQKRAKDFRKWISTGAMA